ncbi:polar amino acid ABC transporter permease [Lactobacillus sp. CBA3605]|uniref:amino acid ABC transporter permease n=1 Tax=Lactobacillus sp. CBA3605 TaxID=2099788 RepID=UPI000CFBD955|nr:ABC transporter permease subunit [Lactobacillus sp. CBA3605]AVK61399.1 polar amino acid ABC transporter permease [Lactobacillus sp. CBA3605]
MSSWVIIQQSLPLFEKGFFITLKLAALGIIGAIIIGLTCSLIQYFKLPVLNPLVTIYTEVARNTPLLIQLFFLYYAFPALGWRLTASQCGVIGLIFLGGSYMAAGFSGGFDGITSTQLEAGQAIGLNRWQLAQYVILPQGLTLSVPALAANIIFLIKETSIFTVIAIPELTNTTLDLIGMYYHTNEYLLTLVVAYAIILIPLSLLLTYLERRVRYGTFGH